MAALLPSSAYGYELSHTQGGVELTWATNEIEYDAVFTIGGDDFALACRRAFDRWSIASHGALQPKWRGPLPAIVGDDGHSTLGIVDPFDPRFGDAGRTVAHTEVFYDTTTGVIREADLALNGETFTFGDGATGAFDTESVLVHELGHAIGLAHTCGDPGRTYPSCFSVPDVPAGHRLVVLEAVMAPTLSVATLRRELTADDRAALAVHYASTATVPEVPVVTRACPGGTLAATPASDELVFRYESGALDPAMLDAPKTDRGDVDLMVIASSGAYAVGYRYVVPAACAVDPPPVEPEGGCDCQSERSPSRQAPWVLLTLGLLLIGRQKWRAAVIGLGVVLYASDADAFKCSRVRLDSGPSLIWETRTIGWWADPQAARAVGDEALGLEELKASFQAWTDVDCSDITLPFLGTREGMKAEYDAAIENVNAVIMVNANWAYDPGAIAVTTNAYDRTTGVVVDADIEVNGQFFDFKIVDGTNCSVGDEVMDLRNALTHEVGHVIGLDHPPGTPRYAEATMYASAPPCETKKRTLAQDDRDGICTIYPSGLTTKQCFPPDGPSFVQSGSDDGFGCTSTRSGSSTGALLLAALIVARRRRV